MSPPSHFNILVGSLRRPSATTTSAECATVFFPDSSGNSDFTMWTFVSNPGGVGLGQFKSKGNGGYAVARNNTVVVCRHLGSADEALWKVLDNGNGTCCVATRDGGLIWSVNQNRLVLISAQNTVTPSETFTFPDA